jgi:hypothetical protein
MSNIKAAAFFQFALAGGAKFAFADPASACSSFSDQILCDAESSVCQWNNSTKTCSGLPAAGRVGTDVAVVDTTVPEAVGNFFDTHEGAVSFLGAALRTALESAMQWATATALVPPQQAMDENPFEESGPDEDPYKPTALQLGTSLPSCPDGCPTCPDGCCELCPWRVDSVSF